MRKRICMKILFAIEKKLVNPMFTRCYNANMEYIGGSRIKCFFNDWHLHKKYKTEKQRNEAFRVLSEKSDLWEYRKLNL